MYEPDRFLEESDSFNRMCIVGYGLEATLLGIALSQENSGFIDCGIMINPITDWLDVGK